MFARFEGANGEYGAHEFLEATSEDNYEGFEEVGLVVERYARGELSDEQFDRKLDRLTDTTTLENATETYEPEESRDS